LPSPSPKKVVNAVHLEDTDEKVDETDVHEAGDESPKKNKQEVIEPHELSEKDAVDRIECLFLSFKAR